MERKRNLGLASGSLWLTVISAVFAGGSLLAVRTPVAAVLLAAMCAAAASMVVFGILTIHAVWQLPDAQPSSPAGARRMARRFGTIVAVEALALTLVTVACVLNRRWGLIAPLDLIIVGLHFLPLARLFNVPRYNVTGAFFCGISIATMLLIPQPLRIGHALSWLVIPSVGCALVAWITAAAGLEEVKQCVGAIHAQSVFAAPQ
jgi:hypothetical protein